MANNSQRISPQDQWLFDGEDNLVGVKNPNVHGQDMLPLLYSVDPVTNVVTADITVTTLTTTGNSALGNAEATDTHAIKGATTVLANSASAALTVTQTGAGNAFVVEDSASTDTTPFAINGSGQVLIGTATAQAALAGQLPVLQAHSAAGSTGNSALFANWDVTTGQAPTISFAKSVSDTIGTRGAVANTQLLGSLHFLGDDGTAFIRAAQITAEVDGTPGTNDMPGRLLLSTTADGASSPTERMRIDSAGNVGIGASTSALIKFYLGGTITGGTNKFVTYSDAVFQSDVTASGQYFTTSAGTAAASFTLASLVHYGASQATFGAGSTVTSQTGFQVSNITGATNNYGVYSNIASAANRWNFYSAGSATNYFVGPMTGASNLSFLNATATPAGGSSAGLLMGTANVGIYWGSGAPTVTAAAGSIYIRTDGGASTRLYSTSGGGTWHAITSA